MARVPLTIRMRESDNVAIVADEGGLDAGTTLPGGLVLREPVPQCHKVALVDIAEGAPVLRYAIPIGHALKPIGGCMNACCACPWRARSTGCRWPAPRRRPCRRCRATASRAIAMPTVRAARATPTAADDTPATDPRSRAAAAHRGVIVAVMTPRAT